MKTLFDVDEYEVGYDDYPDAVFHVFVAFSGGKDSVCTLLEVLEHYPARMVTALFCDTGDEAPETYEYIKYIHEKLHPVKRLVTQIDSVDGVTQHRKFSRIAISPYESVEYVRDNFHTVYDEIIMKWQRQPSINPYPSLVSRHCTRTLKVHTVQQYIRSKYSKTERDKVIQAIGIRRNESSRRSKQRKYSFDFDNGYNLWYPVVDYTLQDVWDKHQEAGIKRNSVYEIDQRSNCVGCVFSNPQQIQRFIDKHGVEVMDGWVRVENETGWKLYGDYGVIDLIEGRKNITGYFDNPLFSCTSGYCDME